VYKTHECAQVYLHTNPSTVQFEVHSTVFGKYVVIGFWRSEIWGTENVLRHSVISETETYGQEKSLAFEL